MTQEHIGTALALPNETQFRQDIQAINRFQVIVHQNLVLNQDYGVIPGTTKLTLLKPGAEKIAKLLGLSDQYEIVDQQEDWSKPFFRYLVKCKLIHVASQSLISEGLGECNSMESKYRWRWISERDLPVGIDKTKLVSQERHATSGGRWTVYRFENDDIYSQVNTILKMAKKRALVDAALSAGRLSNVFTQDIEDLPKEVIGETGSEPIQKRQTVDRVSHYCDIHGVNFFKKGNMKGYAHPIEGTKVWCNEEEPEPTPKPTRQATSPSDEEAEELWDKLVSEKIPETKEKDHTLVTASQLKSIQALLEANSMGGTDLRKWCNADPRKWEIKSSTALEAWQYDEIRAAFLKAAPVDKES